MGQQRKLVKVNKSEHLHAVGQRAIVAMGIIAFVAVRKPKTHREFVAHTHVHLANKTCHIKTCHKIFSRNLVWIDVLFSKVLKQTNMQEYTHQNSRKQFLKSRPQ